MEPMQRLMMGGMGLGALGLLFGIFWLLGRKRRRRRQTLETLAGRLGWKFAKKDTLGIRRIKFMFFAWTRGKVENLIHGQVNGVHVRLFDYSYGTDAHGDTRTFAMFKVADRCAGAVIANRVRYGPALSHASFQEIATRHGALDDKLAAFSMDPGFGSELMSHGLAEYVTGRFRFLPYFEIRDGWLIFSIGWIGEDSWTRFLNTSASLREHLPPGILPPLLPGAAPAPQ